jgi:hypothetical protein
MSRLYFCLRLFAIAIAFPAIALYIAGATLVQAIVSATHRSPAPRASSLRVPLRIWLSVMDWTKGIHVGYTYWEQYEAPVMLDEIAVHHDE